MIKLDDSAIKDKVQQFVLTALAQVQTEHPQVKLNLVEDSFEHNYNRLINFVETLSIWNKAMNLVADINEVFTRHIADSLSLLPFVLTSYAKATTANPNSETPFKVIDFGSGAGFPSLVLAIFLPQINFTLTDKLVKKIDFLTFCKAQLGLNNLNILKVNLNDLQDYSYNLIVTRAFASLDKINILTQPFVANKAEVFIMAADLEKIKENLNESDILQKAVVYNLSDNLSFILGKDNQYKNRNLIVLKDQPA